MSTRKPQTRGATRNPRGAAPRKPASGASRNSKSSGKAGNGILKGRLAVALLLIAALAGGITFMLKRPAKPVSAVPPALADEKAAPNEPRNPPSQEAAQPTAPAPDRFEFYEILPKQEVLPTRKLDNRPVQRPRVDAPAGKEPEGMQLWLQSGAFRSAADADKRRAQIRLLGLPARVSQGQDAQGITVQRVIAGPFGSASSLDSARRTLAAAGMDAIPLDGPPRQP